MLSNMFKSQLGPDTEIGKNINPIFVAMVNNVATEEDSKRLIKFIAFYTLVTKKQTVAISDEGIDRYLNIFCTLEREKASKRSLTN